MKVEIALKTYLEKRELEKIRSYYQKMGLNVNPQILHVNIVENNFVINSFPTYLPYSAFEDSIKSFFKLIYPNKRIGLIFNGDYKSIWN